jgi:hypothetical protein
MTAFPSWLNLSPWTAAELAAFLPQRLVGLAQSEVTMAFLDEMAQEIEALLNNEVVDLWRLRELALSEGGLVNGTKKRLK